MNEPDIRLEEQIISLFQDRETHICQGWILKKMGDCLLVYPLYYKFAGEYLGQYTEICVMVIDENPPLGIIEFE